MLLNSSVMYTQNMKVSAQRHRQPQVGFLEAGRLAEGVSHDPEVVAQEKAEWVAEAAYRHERKQWWGRN